MKADRWPHRRIKQIVPATGWVAVYAATDTEPEERLRLAVWAVVDEIWIDRTRERPREEDWDYAEAFIVGMTYLGDGSDQLDYAREYWPDPADGFLRYEPVES